MSINTDDLMELLPSQQVVINNCEAREHGNNEGCLCHLKGTIQILDKRYATPFVGTPTWHLKGLSQRVRLSEITLIKPGAISA